LNILIVAPCNLDTQIPTTGFGNRVINLAKALSYKRSNVTILHFGTDQKKAHLNIIGCSSLMKKVNSENLIVGGMDRYLSSINPSLIRMIKDLCQTENPDVIQVESPYPFVPSYLSKRTEALISLDQHNAEFFSVLSKFDKRRHFVMATAGITLPYVFLVESFAVNRSDMILSVSRNDVQRLMKLHHINQDKIVVIPNGVDISMFDRTRNSSKENLFGICRKVVFFHGSLGWYPNLEAASIITDVIAPRISTANFVICGSNAPNTFLRKASNCRNVNYAGYVENIEEFISNSDICIAPILRGGGTRLKIMEYAAAGKPIVATYKAAEGLPLVNEVHALLFKNVDTDFIDGVEMILSDETLAEKIGSNARKLAVRFDWKVIGSRLYDKYASLLKDRKDK